MTKGFDSEDSQDAPLPMETTTSEELLSDIQHFLPAWLPMLECLQSEDVPLKKKIDTLTRIKPFTQGSSGFQILPQLVKLLRTTTDVAFAHALMSLLGQVKAFCLHETLVDIALATGIRLFEAPQDYRAFIEKEEVIKLRCMAIRLLGLLNNQNAIVPLMGLLNDVKANYRVRLEAAESLGRLRDPKAMQPLIRLLKDEQESSLYLQESAVKALGLLGDIRALDPLLDLFESKKGVREKCQFLFERILDAVGKLASEENLSRNERQKALDGVLGVIDDKAVSIRLSAVEALGSIGDASHIPLLETKLFDENMEVAHSALASLYKIGGMPVIKAVLALDELPKFLREEILDFLLLNSEEDDDNEANEN